MIWSQFKSYLSNAGMNATFTIFNNPLLYLPASYFSPTIYLSGLELATIFIFRQKLSCGVKGPNIVQSQVDRMKHAFRF